MQKCPMFVSALCRLRYAVFVMLALLMVSTTSVGQMETATLSGTVLDQSGAVVPDAGVQVTNSDTNIITSTTTNKAGVYVLSSLKPGRYRVVVTKLGFKQVSVTDVILNVQDLVSRNFNLQVGATSETISVAATAAEVQMSPAVATVIDQNLVRELPLNGRSFQTLFALTPGVTIAVASFGDPGQFSINGQRTSANYFTVDGASANTGIGAGFPPGQAFGGSQPALTASGGMNGLVSVDAVQEFAIQTSSYAAEFGHTPGGQISIVTKSGTNQLHGDVFDYLRNDALDANDWLANHNGLRRAALRQNDFGGTLGGPVVKNRAFYFLSYEGLRLQQPTTGLSDVPTVSVRNSAPAPIRPYLRAFPLPTGTDEGNGLAPADYSFANPTRLDASSLRVDYHFTDALSIFTRYDYSSSKAKVRGNGLALNNVIDTPFSLQTLTSGLTYAITPRIADEIRFNWSRSDASSLSRMDNFGGAVPLSPDLVFPSVVNVDRSLFSFFLDNGLNAQLSLGPNVSNSQQQINLIQNVSWQWNAHLFKFGFDYRRLTPTFAPASYFQQVVINDVPAALAQTASSTFLQSFAGSVHGVVSNYSLYLQDTWKAGVKFAVVYGLRWDYDPTPSAQSSNGLRPVVLVTNGDLDQLSFAGPGSPLYHSTKNNFAPRLGAAYQVRDSPRSEAAIRAGFGMFYDLGNGAVGNTFGFYPFAVSSTDFNAQSFPLTMAAAAPPVLSSTPPFPTIQAFPRTLKLPYTYHWNLSYEQALGTKQNMTVGYVGSGGHSLTRGLDVFSPPLPSAFEEIRFITNGGYSNYNSLQVSFQRRATKGLEILASYTLAHSLDNASDDQGLSAPDQFVKSNADYASSDFDIRHTGSAALDYEFPSPHGSRVMAHIFGGWSGNLLFTGRSSPPVNVSIQRFLSFGPYLFRPDRIPGVPLYIDDPSTPGGRRFNAVALSDPTSPAQGDLGRNQFRGFRLLQADLSIRRSFPLTEKVRLEGRLEAFNVLNHPNFAPPQGFLGTEAMPGQVILNPAFGVAQSMLNQGLQGGFGAGFSPLYQIGGPRSLQLALKLEF